MRARCLDTRAAIGFALDITRSREYLHSLGILHRDLKPGNLSLKADHKTVKLVDFCLAREESLTEMMTAETGTYGWMAPENMRTSAESLPEELTVILTSCWEEDPHACPNFSPIIQMLRNYFSTIAPPEPTSPPQIFALENILPPESPGTSSLMAVHQDSGETPKAKLEN